MADELRTAEMPVHAQVLLEHPLYTPMSVKDQTPWLKILRHTGFQFDAHCVYCKKMSPFKVDRATVQMSHEFINAEVARHGYFSVVARCTRNGHVYVYHFLLAQEQLTKIGQNPSLEDIAGADIEKYRSQLKGGAFSELRKATGLASHGIGIGAFVYLRRIFERLISEHRVQVEAEGGLIEDFDSKRMVEKIEALKAVLPVTLVKHASAYAILSKGLHELSEDECKLYFPVVRKAIVQMLEEDWIQRERRRAEKALEQDLQRITTELKHSSAAPKMD